MSDAVRRNRISESSERLGRPQSNSTTKRPTRGPKLKRQSQDESELRRSRRLRLLPPDYSFQPDRYQVNNIRPSTSGSSAEFVQSMNSDSSSSSDSEEEDDEDDISSTETNRSARSATLTVSLDMNSPFVTTMSAETDTSSSSSDEEDPIAVPSPISPAAETRPEPVASTSSNITFPRPVNLGHRPDLPNRTSLSLAHRQMWFRQQREQELRRRNMVRAPVRRVVAAEHTTIRISEIVLHQREQENPTRALVRRISQYLDSLLSYRHNPQAGTSGASTSRPLLTSHELVAQQVDNNSNATQNLFRELWSGQSRSPVQRYLDNMSQLLERMRRESIRATPEMINSHTILFDFASVHLKSAQTQCVICLSNFELGQKMRRLPCVHLFHRACIDKWLLDNRCCPICRHPISDRKLTFTDGMPRQNLTIHDH